MRLNAFPQPPKNPIEKSVVKEDELINQVEIIEGVLGKLKARIGAANEDKFSPIQFLGNFPSPIVPAVAGEKHYPLDPMSIMYPTDAFFNSPKKSKLFKGVEKTKLDQLQSVDMSSDSDIFNLLNGCRKNEKRVLIDGIIYGNGMLKLNPRIYRYCEYFPDYGKSLFHTLGKARDFENNLESRIKKLFGLKFDSSVLNDQIRGLYRKQIEEIITKSLEVIEKLYLEADDVEWEHSVYDDNVTTDYITGQMYEDDGEEVPEYLKDAKDLIDPDSKSLVAKMQEKHVLILEKINNEIKDMSREMESINLSVFLFLGTFKTLKDGGVDFSLEDINNSSFKEAVGNEIPPKEVAEMIDIYGKNQSGNTDVQKELIMNFKNRIEDGKTRFYSFSYDGHTHSFIAFTPQEDGSSYASAFNVAPSARGYRIGEAMLHEAMDKEAREHILTADCDSKLPISAKYIETGWVATRYWDDHGDKILDIVRNDREREKYGGKQLTQEEIISGNIPENTFVKTAKEQKDLPFELCNEGYVLTRMFLDQKSRQHYAVFEPVPPAHTESETGVGASHK